MDKGVMAEPKDRECWGPCAGPNGIQKSWNSQQGLDENQTWLCPFAAEDLRALRRWAITLSPRTENSSRGRRGQSLPGPPHPTTDLAPVIQSCCSACLSAGAKG
jgi:hypothetical protein